MSESIAALGAAPCEQFVDQVLEFHRRSERVTHHILSNHNCEIDGNTAHAATCLRCLSVVPSGPHRLAFGRFVDRFEKRDGRWGIVARVSLPEGATELTPCNDRAGMINDARTLGHPARDRSDPSHLRPLPLTRG